jgi:heme-degrading monooxygenase HmoA
MFMNVAFVNAGSGSKDELIANMRNFAKSFENAPGLIGAHIMSEKGTSTLMGISIWLDEGSFNAAMAKIPVRPQAAAERKWDPPVVRQFVEL